MKLPSYILTESSDDLKFSESLRSELRFERCDYWLKSLVGVSVLGLLVAFLIFSVM